MNRLEKLINIMKQIHDEADHALNTDVPDSEKLMVMEQDLNEIIRLATGI